MSASLLLSMAVSEAVKQYSEQYSNCESEWGDEHDSKCGRAISVGSIKDDTAEFKTKHPYMLALCFMLLGLLLGGTVAYAAGLLPSLLVLTATLLTLLTLSIPAAHELTYRSLSNWHGSCHQGKPQPQNPLCSDTDN